MNRTYKITIGLIDSMNRGLRRRVAAPCIGGGDAAAMAI
jgi:hypothetical protein